MNNKEKMKTVVDLIVETDYQKAKTELKKIISQHPKMKAYKKDLAEMGLSLKRVEIPDTIYEQLQEIIAEYDKPLQLSVLDETYKKICQQN